MTIGEFGVGLAVTGLMFFIFTGIAQGFMPIGAALIVGAAGWMMSAYGFIRTLKGNRHLQRS